MENSNSGKNSWGKGNILSTYTFKITSNTVINYRSHLREKQAAYATISVYKDDVIVYSNGTITPFDAEPTMQIIISLQDLREILTEIDRHESQMSIRDKSI